jgi:hypothetical protein
VPQKPTKTNPILIPVGFSLSKRVDKIFTKSGVVIIIAANSPTGKNFKLNIARKVVNINKTPLKINIQGLEVTKTVRPATGKIKRVVMLA